MPTTNGVFTHQITTGYKSDEGTLTTVVASFTGDAETGVEDSLALGATNKAYVFAVTISKIVSCVLWSSVSCTIKTNSSTTPQETITLGAGGQVAHPGTTNNTLPFAGNLTGLYVTNTDTKAGTFRVRFLLQV